MICDRLCLEVKRSIFVRELFTHEMNVVLFLLHLKIVNDGLFFETDLFIHFKIMVLI